MPERREIKYYIAMIWLGVILALAIVALIAVNLNRTAVAESERAFQKNLEFLADSSAKSVQLFLDGIISRIVPLTQIDVVKNYKLDEVELAFGSVISELDERVSHMILLGDSGEVKVAVTKGPDHFKMLPQINGFFRDTMSGWHVNISSELFVSDGYRGIAVGMPIFRKSEEAPPPEEKKTSWIYKAGMIMALIDIDDLVGDLIDPIHVEDSGFAWLYTQGGIILANREKLEGFSKMLYGLNPGALGKLTKDFENTLKGDTAKGWKTIGANGHDIVITRDGEEWRISTGVIEALDQKWILAIAAPSAEATRILNKSFTQSFILFFIVVAILVIGGSLMTRVNRRWARAEEKALYASELEEKNRSLYELNRRMDEFVSVVSHDIRSPLNVIRGFVKMIQSSPDGAKFDRETSVMLRSCNRLMQLVNDILDVSKLEAGKVTLAYDPVVIDEIIMESVRTMEFAAGEKDQNISVDLGDATKIDGDGAKLLQVMNNLISNAVKFTPKGGEVSVTKEVNGSHVMIMISDTGPGIPEEERGFVFDKFEQVKRHHQGVEPGSGLGLTICKSIVELHGGLIGVTSDPGHGSTFYVRLPLRKPDHDAGEEPKTEDRSGIEEEKV